jgi:sigma-B regulation protein RsbU (phosphoserine phosphatase)
MPGYRSHALPPAATDDDRGARHALLNTLPGRVVVVGVAAKLLVLLVRTTTGGVPAFLDVVDTVVGVAVAVAAACFVYRLGVTVKRRLLWRVRRKLILSYIFIGVVPALLIVAFFLLGGLLLFYNFSSYLVQSRLRAQADRARLLAVSTALEIQRGGGVDVAGTLARRQAAAAGESRELSIAVVPVDRPCADTRADAPPIGPSGPSAAQAQAGPWAHVDAPRALPRWIACDGFGGLLAYSHVTGLAGAAAPPRGVSLVVNGRRVESSDPSEDTHMFVRAAAFPDSPRPGYAVIVDIPVTEQVRQQLRRETGVEVKNVSAVEGGDHTDAKPIAGRPGGDSGAAPETGSAVPFSWVSFLEYRDWDSGASGTLLVSTEISIGEIYDRIAAAPGLIGNRSFGQALLLVLLVVIGGLFLVIEAVALVVGLALAKSITGSVHELFIGTERVRQGDFTHKIAVKAHDQLGELAESFNSMTASVEHSLQQADEKKRLEEELRIAREIQMSLLPQGALEMPGVAVTTLCVPAREVGGDYYDFLPLDDHRLGVLIADVSGKGTPAALYMAVLKGVILSLSQIHTSPRELMISANRIIARNLDARSFITMTYAVIDLEARTMTYARAGHTPLIYVPGPGAPSRRVQILTPDGLVLGLHLDHGEMFERLLEEAIIPLRTGDLYLFFTDGMSEAMNVHDDCFGESRLGEIVEAHAHLPTDELRERLLREIEAFVGDAPQHDDMTMILLRIEDRAAAAASQVAEPVEIPA